MDKSKEVISIKNIVKKYGKDLSKVDLSNYKIEASFSDMRGVILPKNKKLFQETIVGSLFEAKMPEVNYNDYDLEGVDISYAVFFENSTLPDDVDFFQKLGGNNSCLKIV